MRLGVLQPQNPAHPSLSLSLLVKDGKVRTLIFFFFKWKSSPLLTLTTLPELLPQCQAQEETKNNSSCLVLPRSHIWLLFFCFCAFPFLASFISRSGHESILFVFCGSMCVLVCVCLERGINKKINICFKCEIYRQGLGEEREVEADSWNAEEEGHLETGQPTAEGGHHPRWRCCSFGCKDNSS